MPAKETPQSVALKELRKIRAEIRSKSESPDSKKFSRDQNEQARKQLIESGTDRAVVNKAFKTLTKKASN